jgi:predicted PurR-regulated permease PerM
VKKIPSAFQRNVLWTAITALSITLIGALGIGLIYLGTRVIAFLQPILIPFALAGVLAYLLDPAVKWIERHGLSRQKAVLVVFATFSLAVGGLGTWVGFQASAQSGKFVERFGTYSNKARHAFVGWVNGIETKYNLTLLPHLPEPRAQLPTPEPTEAAGPSEATDTKIKLANSMDDFDLQSFITGDWVRTTLPTLIKNAWGFVKTSVGGFMGIFGFLLSFIIVPLYLFYFLTESAHIKETWSHYLPLRASDFKTEVVDCLTEINGYLIAFFRGQLFVSLINGLATGVGLMILGLDFGLLIGLMLCLLGMIPYLGIVLCWVPAVVIASVQGPSTFFPDGTPWWALPLMVTIIFAAVQQVDGLFITPKIVGESVGLHPMTVIVSVFVWALILGGLLGAILAVPMTASIKVLFQRYVWRARLAAQTVGGAASPSELP